MKYSVKEGMRLIRNAFENKQDCFILPTKRTVRLSRAHKTFVLKGVYCSWCRLPGSFFQETPLENNKARFNLFAKRGRKKVLMTRDHIIPASCGGANRISNMQTMCLNCNRRKGSYFRKQRFLYPYKSIKDYVLNTQPPNYKRLVEEVDTLVFGNRDKSGGPLLASRETMKEYLEHLNEKYETKISLNNLHKVPE